MNLAYIALVAILAYLIIGLIVAAWLRWDGAPREIVTLAIILWPLFIALMIVGAGAMFLGYIANSSGDGKHGRH